MQTLPGADIEEHEHNLDELALNPPSQQSADPENDDKANTVANDEDSEMDIDDPKNTMRLADDEMSGTDASEEDESNARESVFHLFFCFTKRLNSYTSGA